MDSQFDQQAAEYSFHSGIQRIAGRALLAKLDQLLQKPDSVLDIGCGAGFLSQQLKHSLPNSNITGLDPSRAMLNQAENYLDEKIESKFEDFKTSRKYDLIVSNLAFQWMESPIDEIIRTKSLLNNKGSLYINLLTSDSFHEVKQTFQKYGVEYPGLKLCDKSETVSYLEKEGFQLQEFSYIDYLPTCLSFFKGLKQIGAITSQFKTNGTGQLKKIFKNHDIEYKEKLKPFSYKGLIISYKEG